LSFIENKKVEVLGHEVFEGELILKEVYDTGSLPKNKGI
jgi:hypothetical protein